MQMNVEIIAQKGDLLTVKLHSELDVESLETNAYGGRFFAYLEPVLKDTTTDLQRKHYWALIGDISEYTGDPKWQIVLRMKYLYMLVNDKKKEPSMARNAMKSSDARLLIQTIIDYALEHDIPLKKDYLSQMEEKQLFAMTMKRKCWLCGKHADIHHVDSLGAGRNRDTYQHHDKHQYMALCREHHQLVHQMGKRTFEQKYHVKGIQLSQANLKELGVI